jgi:TP901 family phage tail tape measure protein
VDLLANQDDLSVNINVGLDIDEASFNEVNQAIDGVRANIDNLLSVKKDKQKDFITEIKKQLGFGPDVEIQIGGYSVKEPLRKANQKAGKGFEKIAGGAFDGAGLADKAEVAIARALNEAGKEFGKRFNVNFVDDFAESMKDISFKKNTKSEISAAKEYIKNSVDPGDAQKISQMLGLEASNVLSKAISKTDFVIPGDEDALASLSTQIENGVEDFVVNSLKSVTISPAMFIAAADRALQNQPNVKTNSETGMSIGGWTRPYRNAGVVSDPTPIFNGRSALEATPDQISRFDKIAAEKEAQVGGEKLAAAFTYAVGKDLDEIVIGAWEKASKEVASNKDIEKILREDPTFSISGIAASDAFANLEIYIMDRFIENVKEGELGKGYQSGSFASNLNSIKSASRGETILDFPDDPMNVLPKDKVLNWLNTMIEDGVMHPLQQIFENPGILGKAFVSNSESAMKSGFTRLIKESSGERTLSKNAQAEKEYNDQLRAQTQELVNAAKWLNARITGDIPKAMENLQSGNVPQISKNTEIKKESENFAKNFFDAMRGGEFESFKGELKGSLQEFENQKDKKRMERLFGGPIPDLVPELYKKDSAAIAGKAGGSLSPDIELLRKYLTEQKALAEKQGKVFQVGLDTEFNVATKEKVTELGMAAVEATDGLLKIREIFKFFQMPSNAEEMLRGYNNLPKDVRAGQVGTPEGLIKRAAEAGVPKELVGDTDPKANLIQYRQKMQKLIDILDLLSELGIKLTGNSFDTAEISNITKGINYINEASKQMGLSDLKQPNFGNFFDPVKNSALYSSDEARPELRNVYRDEKGSASASLNDVITRIANTQPAWFKQFESSFKMNQKGTAFEYTGVGAGGKQKNFGPHVAMADAAASAVISQYIKDFGGALSVTLEKVTNKINEEASKAAYSASGGGGNPPIVPPSDSSDKGMADFNDRSPDAIIKRIILTSKELEQPLSTIFTTIDGLKSKFPVLQKLTDAEMVSLQKRIEILQSDKSGEGHLQVLTELALKEKELADTRKEMSGLSQGNMGFILQQRRSGMQGPLTEDQAALKDTGGVERYDKLTQGVIKLREETSKLTATARQNEIQAGLDVIEISRKGHVTEQLTDNLRKQVDAQIESTQAGKTATSMIKAQMQEQVNAQKEVQRQTQSLMNTWVTSRYALYDVGNFYANFSQQLFQLTRQIFNTTDSYRRFESAFTSVERAMQLPRDAADDLRQQFILLSETIPVSFEEISKIATLGAQMGITARGIVGFTETVAQFAAVTGISAETVAQQFGRIAELADVDSSQFVNLGSAVTYAGVNAVATESEILTLSQSIAAVSNQVGITAPEIIGLGTALASVGIPAEQARGVFTRVFADIDRAASTGGESLQDLAEITGMSAEQIQASWGTEGAANQVFIALLDGLNASDNLTASFDKLNIVETREINTLTRLAKNMNVVNQALNDSSLAYDDASFLGESFGKTVDNLDSKILLFKNNLDSLLSTFSQGFVPTMEFVLDLGSGFLKFLKSLDNSFLLKGVLPASAILIALGGVLAGTGAIVAKLTAQVYAFRVAMINAANNPTSVAGFAAQVRALTGLGSAVFEIRKDVEGINTRGLIEPMNLTGKDAPSMFAGQEKQNAYLLKEKNLYIAVGDAVKKTNSAKEAGATTAIQLARLEADQVNKAITTRRLQIEQLENSASSYDAVNKASTPSAANLQGQRLRNQYAEMYIATVKGEIVTISGAKKAALERLKISQYSTAATKEEAKAILARTTAVNLSTTAATRAVSGIGGMVNKAFLFIAIAGTIITTVNAIATAVGNLNKIDLLGSGGGLESLREAIRQDTKDLASGEMLPSEVITTATVEQKTYKQVVDESANSIGNFTSVSTEFTDGFKATTEEIKNQTVALGTNTKEWLANAVFQNEKLQEWVDKNPDVFNQMQESMASMGITFDGLIKDLVAKSEGANIDPLKKVKQALADIDKRKREISRGRNQPVTAEERAELDALNKKAAILAKIIAFVNELGPAVGGALDKMSLQTAIAEAFGLGDAFEKAADDVQDFGGGAEKEIKTLTDWVGELSSVLQAAFNIRYGQEVGLDAISSSWIELRKAAQDAEKAVKSANDEINKSYADQDVLQYQLSVAERYGDEKRAATLRAKLSELDTKIIDQQQKLEDANNATSKSLTGNSRASIDNRAKVRDLVTQYNSYLVALANTGMSNEDLKAQAAILKQEFLDQGVALGFAQNELSSYTTAFGQDFTTVINNLPKDITLSVNTDPAMRAVEEFVSKAKSALGSVGVAPIAPSTELPAAPVESEYASAVRTAMGKSQRVTNEVVKLAGADSGSADSRDRKIASFLFTVTKAQSEAILKLLNTGGASGHRMVASGGYISGPGTGTSDSIPAMLSNGEYVVKAKSVSAYGLDFMNALNEQRVGFNPVNQSSSGSVGGGSSVVYLSPEDRALLRSVVDRPVALYTENTKIAQSANAGNVLLAQRGSK